MTVMLSSDYRTEAASTVSDYRLIIILMSPKPKVHATIHFGMTSVVIRCELHTSVAVVCGGGGRSAILAFLSMCIYTVQIPLCSVTCTL